MHERPAGAHMTGGGSSQSSSPGSPRKVHKRAALAGTRESQRGQRGLTSLSACSMVEFAWISGRWVGWDGHFDTGMACVRGPDVTQDRDAMQLLHPPMPRPCFVQPVNPRPAVARELQQQLPAMAPVRDVPHVAGQMVTVASRHRTASFKRLFRGQTMLLNHPKASFNVTCQALSSSYHGQTCGALPPHGLGARAPARCRPDSPADSAGRRSQTRRSQ